VQVTTTGTVQGRGVVATKHFSPNQYIFVSQPKFSRNSSVTERRAGVRTFKVENKNGDQLVSFEDKCLDYSSSQDSDFVRYMNIAVGTLLFQEERGMMVVKAIRDIRRGEELLDDYDKEVVWGK
jgi:hypothetical protein